MIVHSLNTFISQFCKKAVFKFEYVLNIYQVYYCIIIIVLKTVKKTKGKENYKLIKSRQMSPFQSPLIESESIEFFCCCSWRLVINVCWRSFGTNLSSSNFHSKTKSEFKTRLPSFNFFLLANNFCSKCFYVKK